MSRYQDGGGTTRPTTKKSELKKIAQHVADVLVPQGARQGILECEGNRLLWLYYREIYREEQAAGEAYEEAQGTNHWLRTVSRLHPSIQGCQHRITNKVQLESLKFFGPATTKLVDVLWELYPPEPLTAQEENMIQAQQALEQEALEHQRQAEKARKAAERRQKRAAEKAAFELDFSGLGHFAGAFSMADINRIAPVPGGDSDSDDDLGGRGQAGGRGRGRGRGSRTGGGAEPRPRAPRQPKEYCPKVGTANYAFLITLYMSAKQGHEFETKQSLMEKAEQSGLSTKSLFNTGQNQSMLNPGDRFYDGWSSMNKGLVNRTPPLVIAWSNPKKVKLSDEGRRLAARLYQDAVTRGKVAPLPGVDPTLDMAPAQGGVPGSGPAAGLAGDVLGSQGAGGSLGAGQARPGEHLGSQGAGPGAGRGGSAGAAGVRGTQHRVSGAGTGAGAGATGLGSGQQQPQQQAPRYPDVEHEERRPVSNKYGAWGGALLPGDEGFMYGSEEEDIYGYGLNQVETDDEQGARKRARASGSSHTTTFKGSGRALGQMAAWADVGAAVDEQQEAVRQLPPAQAARIAAEKRIAAAAGNASRAAVVCQDLTIHDRAPGGGAATAAGQQAGGGAAGGQQAAAGGGSGRQAEVVVLFDSDDDDPIVNTQHPNSVGRQPASRTGAAAPPSAFANLAPITGTGQAAAVQGRGSGSSLSRGLSGPLAHLLGEPTGRADSTGAGAPPRGLPPRASGGVAAAAAGNPRPQAATNPELKAQRSGSLPTSSSGDGDGGAAAAAAAGQAYRWLMPCLSDMPSDGSPAPLRLPPLPPGKTFLDVVLILDQREQFARTHAGHHLNRIQACSLRADQIRSQGLLVEQRTLAIGDAVWVARSRAQPHIEYMLDSVLERKSCPDLISSIQDKQRFVRQKWWLQLCGLNQVMYLIEGHPDRMNLNPRDVKTIKTVMMGNELDGLRVLRTEHVNETVALLARLTQSLTRAFQAQKPDSGAQADQDSQVQLYSVWNDRVKRMRTAGLRTVRDVWGCMLAAVPGLGPNTVEAITCVYPTPGSLYTAYKQAAQQAVQRRQDPLAACQSLLADLHLQTGVARVANRSKDVFNCLFREGSSFWKLDR